MQFPVVAKPPVGIVFDTALQRIDEVLALAMLHGFEGRDQARIGAIAITSGDLRAAQFCDAVRLYYASATTGPAAMFMHSPPVGLADARPAVETPMFAKAAYKTTVKSIIDTADSATLIRNALMAQYDQNAAVVLSGPATGLAQLLDTYGVKDWIARKVRLLSIADDGAAADAAAMRKVLADWPTPIVIVGPEIGEALAFPGASIDRDFSATAANPTVDAYRAYKTMPYDTPSWAMAALLYAVHPKDGYFKLSSGTNGSSRLILDPAQKEHIVKTYIEMASAKPVPRKPRHPIDEKKDEKKKDEAKKKDAEN